MLIRKHGSDRANRKELLGEVLDNPNLPSPPALVLQIVEKASKPDCDPAEVISLLNKDSGLCGQVLKTVNSGLYGLSKPVGSLKQGVLILGVKPLRSLVLSLALPAFGTPKNDGALVQYWQESVAGAVIARELAVLLKRKEPDDDLVAGLLRDVGILVLNEVLDEDYRELRKRAAATWVDRQCEEETEAFGFNHAEVSGAILESWGLPEEVVQPILHHHDPEGCTAGGASLQQRAWILCFASKVAALHTGSTTSVSELVQMAQKQFGLDQFAVIKFMGSVMPGIQEFAKLMKVDIGQCPNYAGIITTGCQELVRLSVETKQSAQLPTSAHIGEAAESSVEVTRVTGPNGKVNDEFSRLPEFDLDCLEHLPEGGVRLDAYEIKQRLGRGGMGIVFKAYDPALDRFVAVKMMTPERVIQQDFRRWFSREARAAAGIQHENVVTIYVVSEMKGIPYMVMEYLPGFSLQDRLNKDGPLPLADVYRIGRQIASGLGAAHRRKVIHRDIKPDNVLFDRENGTVKIVDFGLARVTDEVNRSQPQGSWVGTPLYMSPEQFSSMDIDHRSDLFSLGSLLYTISAGKTPFSAEKTMILMQKICNELPMPLRSLRPDVPVWFVNLVSKLHAKTPASRFQSADEVVQEFMKNA